MLSLLSPKKDIVSLNVFMRKYSMDSSIKTQCIEMINDLNAMSSSNDTDGYGAMAIYSRMVRNVH